MQRAENVSLGYAVCKQGPSGDFDGNKSNTDSSAAILQVQNLGTSSFLVPYNPFRPCGSPKAVSSCLATKCSLASMICKCMNQEINGKRKKVF